MSAGDPQASGGAPPCALSADRALAVLIAGLTKGGERTLGLSVLFDATAELSSLASLLSGSLAAEDVAPLLEGITRRLDAALELLRAEHASPSEGGAA